ncbi:cytidylate kinase [Vagococcus penaei]|uniref:Cytidylate kinase n=1 Tax=Vagococcus penaei TaxID=633807 RepID=A0A1Q2D3L0_9ENTE|nr:(d)CMP kinase [Vagococcus penaei]AQP52964.1 cytidylate kinase [Vagococcus penaei]RSU02576.1 cytidylate kinase [Vagococcus penaei]
MKKTVQIAIDGPASAGKSTVAKILAKQLGFVYCDTGAMYRSLTLAALQKEIPLEDEEALLNLLNHLEITFKQLADGQHVYLNDEDVTLAIRSIEVTKSVSEVSAFKQIREEMVKRQKTFSLSDSIIMDGRDIGTVVLPNADLKIFLVASVEERAERRFKENQAKGIPADFDEIKKDIAWRDNYDSTRKNSPLVQAKDAVLLDTTGLSINDVVNKILDLAKDLI